MRRRRDPVPRARAAGHWLAGILVLGLLAGGVVSAAVVLWENLDVRQLAPAFASDPGPLPAPEPPVAPALEDHGFDAVVLRSPRNRAFFPNAEYYPGSIQRWTRLIRSLGGAVREVSTADELAAVTPSEVLVIPDAPCLSDAELRAVRAHLAAGGSLVTNWAVGARDERCAWRGWRTIAELTAAPDVRELAVRQALYLTVPAGTPLSPGLDPGTRIELVPEASLALTLPRARVYWSDWALNPAPDESGGGADVAALAFRTSWGGRTAWFGFRLSQAATPADEERLGRLVGNGVRWAAGLASATVAPWPDGRRAALVVAEDMEAEYQNARGLAAVLRERGLRGSFYPVSQMVLDDAGLAEALQGAGDVGSHTSDHQPVSGLSLQDQTVRLRRSWTEIRGWTGEAPEGFRPPEEAYDESTLRAWAEAGGTYVMAVNQARSGSPEIHAVGDGRMVLLSRLIKDDYNVFVQEGALRTERLTAAWLEGLVKMRAMGGLAVVSAHTQIVGSDARLDAVEAVLDTAMAQGDWWIAPGSDVAGWWRGRAGTRLSVEPRILDPEAAPDTLPGAPIPDFRLIVSGPAAQTLSDVWLDWVLPLGSEGLGPLVDDRPVDFVGTSWGVRVPVGDLRPGERRVVELVRAR